MPKGADKFELTLSLQEIVVLFFVMVALFTGLLFFGYRVGNAHNQNAVELPPTPVAPAQEKPDSQQEVPAGVEIEPEIRLENTAPEKPNEPLRAPAKLDGPAEGDWQPLAKGPGESSHGPCKADDYWSFLRQAVPSKHRFFERLADWAGVPSVDDAGPAPEEHFWTSKDAATTEPALIPDSRSEPEAVGCGAPVPRRGGRSVAC